ncbi:MAG: EamA family transporter [Pirellulales bacterium]|nr:EamA family transporter [Pirellulales bacterium]
MWIMLSLLGAFSQALCAAIKKKSLQTPGMNNVIGFVSFAVAGILFGLVHWLKTGSPWHADLSMRFWGGMAGYAGLNILAVWFMYRALDLAEFNHLMPFMTLTSVAIVVPPIFILGEVPTPPALLGIVVVVAGAILMNWHKETIRTAADDSNQRKQNHRGFLYFIVTALCFTFSPTAAKEAIQGSSVLFTCFLVHALIGLGFLGIILFRGETRRLATALTKRKMRRFLLIVVATGLVIVVENGSINAALGKAPVASVMAIKRLMPLFAFVIGYLYFREKNHLRKKISATAMMIVGAVMITLSK